MSYEYYIVTYRKSTLSDIKQFLSKHQSMHYEGSLCSDAQAFAILRRAKNTSITSFFVDGPLAVDCDILPEALISAVLSPRWLMQVSLPESAKKIDLSYAKIFCRFMATSLQGAAYDLQKDKVIWPREQRKRCFIEPRGERIRLIELEWFLPAKNAPSRELPETVLKILNLLCNEALPVRYGTYEPLQGKYDHAERESFIENWQALSNDKEGEHLFWKSKRPCFGGSVSFPSRDDSTKPAGAFRRVNISLSFDERALHQDSRWCETVVDIFYRIAVNVRAFYAAAYVQRNVIARRTVFFDGASEKSPLPMSEWWLGIPTEPTWLSWYGRPYKRLVEQYLPNESIARNISEGILVRLGKLPMDKDELKPLAPNLPKNVLVRFAHQDSNLRDYVVVNLANKQVLAKDANISIPRPIPAEYIPDIQ